MSNTRYLEIDSTYRNRNQWPLPSQFEIPISQHGRDNKVQSMDPVSLNASVKSWCSNAFTVSGGVTATTAITANTLPMSNVTTFVVESNAGTLQPIDQYYLRATLNVTGGTENHRIIDYRFLGQVGTLVRAQITVDPALTTADLAIGPPVPIVINDPTDVTTDTANPIVFVPDGRIGDNGYANYILYDETTGDSRTIIDYSYETHLLNIDTSASGGGPVAWAETDCFSIRPSVPAIRGVTPGPNSTSGVVLPVGASTTDGAYVGDFAEIILTALPVVAPEGETRRIVSYDGATRTATVYPPFTAVPGATTDIVAVLQASYDNAVPFNYTGSLVSQSEDVCYEIELLNLILPNRELNVFRGGRIAFYPYVYVELRNLSSMGAGPGTIYSNNPNSTRMLFRCAIDDTPTPLISPFVKIDGDGMVQTVKFKPNDNLRFSVHMSNGELFQVVMSDTTSPVLPNELVQISALFSIKRL